MCEREKSAQAEEVLRSALPNGRRADRQAPLEFRV